MKYTLLIAAMDEEYNSIVSKVTKKGYESTNTNIGGIDGLLFTVNKSKVFAFKGEIGKVATAFKLGKLSSLIDIKRIINVGCAGSLSEKVAYLDVVVADKVSYYDVDLTPFGYELGQIAGSKSKYFEADTKMLKDLERIDSTIPIHVGTILSGDKFATTDTLKPEIINLFENPLAVDMESGAVAQVAQALQVPFIIIRSISDNATEAENKITHEEFLELSSKRATSVAFHVLNSDLVE